MLERIKELSEAKGVSLNRLEKELGFSRNTLYRLKNQVPGVDKLEILADYFAVSTDYLLGRTDIKEVSKSREDYDVKEKLEQLLEDLDTSENLEYNGKSISEIKKSNIEMALKVVLEINESSGS